MNDLIAEKSTAVALGNFDGMHIGHRAVIDATRVFGGRGLTPLVALFDVHSLQALDGSAPPMLILPEERDSLLSAAGVAAFEIGFSEIRDMSPEEFFESILVKRLGAGAVVCGYNYRFGRGASGDAEMLKRLCGRYSVECVTVPRVCVDGKTVSSTNIRKAVAGGDIKTANKMLGRPFGFSAEVIHGDARGRELGFPTANQLIPEKLIVPKFGVYSSTVTVDGDTFRGITNIGRRPTVGTDIVLSETHILDFDRDIYGSRMDVRLKSFLRPEIKFSSFNELVKQINNDLKSTGS